MTTRAQWLGILCGLLTAMIWGVQSVVSRHAMLIDLTPADVTILRFVSAAAVLLPWALKNMRPFPVGSLGWPRAWGMALLIGPLYSLILVAGASFAPALHSSIISPGLIPVFTALLIFLVTGERAGRMRLIGLGIIVLGIGIFSRDALAMTPSRPDAWIGDLLFVLIAFLWAIFGLLARRWNVSSLEVTAASCILSVPLLVVVALVLPIHMARAPFAELLLQALYQGVLVGVVALYLYARSVETLGAARATLFLPLVPIATAAASALLLAEVPSPTEIVGMAIVVAGMLIAFRSPSVG
ncbi:MULTISPECIES: DMT family transporter [Bosea]|uniref:DMT family transporter n=1 Tax=Bosea TaxID=85413 RepID=UPI00214FFBBE|nr:MULTISPECIES: DMT family transporter [Bosea]MCR4521034.1 DMT family transporter [Bosea sp. 47.2.35]MDR6830679.1 drug/metabolite transporter (DMT)-like permease [Bosea robiniae]MDR6897560.1 drug/metabolite transporter (DMT)-like permease [Bosea sp. BE109]MDR7140957.1 drug/metabolite transporter (DMT)-like permease [Bosea sp. BE168]MDR7177523.1 drug/metabolite transporter (DMT)-like permease [Bosea sp. BE271]